MRTYSVSVTFVDPRIRPRVLLVSAPNRSEARKAARERLTAARPTWAIAEARAAHVPTERRVPAGA
jgi:hypothetical protein